MKDIFATAIQNFDESIKVRFEELCLIVEEVSSGAAEERIWAKLPSFYSEDRFVRIIPFKDHINLEASAVSSHINELKGYKITPKGMLQISNKQPIPVETVKMIIRESILPGDEK